MRRRIVSFILPVPITPLPLYGAGGGAAATHLHITSANPATQVGILGVLQEFYCVRPSSDTLFHDRCTFERSSFCCSSVMLSHGSLRDLFPFDHIFITKSIFVESCSIPSVCQASSCYVWILELLCSVCVVVSRAVVLLRVKVLPIFFTPLYILFDDGRGRRQHSEILNVLFCVFAHLVTGNLQFMSASTICMPKFRVIIAHITLNCVSAEVHMLRHCLILDHVFCFLRQLLEFLLIVFCTIFFYELVLIC